MARPAAWLWMLLVAVALSGCGSEPVTWSRVEREIREQFPDAPSITTDQLAARMEQGERLLLVDIRSAEEYAVSRLPGARLAADGEGLEALLADGAGLDAVVVYCSVGYRSAAVVTALGAPEGVPVFNLAGSLFRWANDGRAMENDKGPASTVHPFNAEWGMLLDPERRAVVE